MIKFLKNICNFILFLRKITKHQLLTYTEKIKLPKKAKFLGWLICFILGPEKFFIKPKKSFGDRLVNFFIDLGPIYIKFGQTLSTQPNLISQDIANHLEFLQDRLPAFDYKIVKTKLEKTFDIKMSEIFSSFNEIPIAAASVAQVHKAKLITGQKVAVKVLRPDILKKYNNDIFFLEFIATLFIKLINSSKRLKLHKVIGIFRESMNCELNLLMEAAAASRFAANFSGDKNIYIPKVYWEFTSHEIITLEWIDGISIRDRKKIINSQLNPYDIAVKIAVIFLNQAYRDGFFHADLHPGNILIKKTGEIVLIDFGIIGLLSEEDRLAIAEILYAFFKRDYKLVASIHYKVGYIPQSTNLELFAQKCRSIAEPIIDKRIKNISVGNLLSQLFNITEEFGMETQPKLLLLQKTFLVIEGIGKSLDRKVNIWQLAEPWIKEWATKNLSLEAKLLRKAKKYINSIIYD